MKKIRRPSPSMAVALAALFVALGGTSYATVSAVLPGNSVGTAQLKNDSVTRAKIAHESITSVLIKDGSLLATDFASGQIPPGPAGPAGPAGAKGDKGDAGPKGDPGKIGPVLVRMDTVTIRADSAGVAAARCAAGEYALSGGSYWPQSVVTPELELETVALTPVADGVGGVIGFDATGSNGTTTARPFTAFARCYKP